MVFKSTLSWLKRSNIEISKSITIKGKLHKKIISCEEIDLEKNNGHCNYY